MKFFLSVLICFITFNSYGNEKNDLYIGSDYYNRVVTIKDLIADVLPPPGFIIEAYLTTLIMVNETELAMKDKKISPKEIKKFDHLVENLRLLKEGLSSNGETEGYFERMKIWNKDLTDKTPEDGQIKELMTKKSMTPAVIFFSIAEQKFIPALKKGDVEEAKKIQHQLKEQYDQHHLFIEEVVKLARKKIQELEDTASKSKSSENKIVSGTNYAKILLLKDLISDILPPPCYVVESYLIDLEMVYTIEKNGIHSKEYESLKNKSLELEKAYKVRFDYWNKNLKLQNLRSLLLTDSHKLVTKFFTEQKTSFYLALEKNNLVLAKNIWNEKLSPLYVEHRNVITKLITKADEHMILLESEIAGHITKNK